MTEKNRSPVTIFGISLKIILIAIILLGIILAVIEPLKIQQSINDFFQTSPEIIGKKSSSPDAQPNNIVVTPEMLSRAIKKIRTDKAKQVEKSPEIIPATRFGYIIELKSGGALNAVDISIEPENVIIISAGGIETTVTRNSIKKIRRFTRPDIERRESQE